MSYKMNNVYKMDYYDPLVYSHADYFDFLRKCYGEELAKDKIGVRTRWFELKGEYKRLIIIFEGEIVGHACAFADVAILRQKEVDMWWGIDAYVLPEFQGKGLGTLLQKRLHDDLCNFSSAWYSPVNGIVKKKCGANELFNNSFFYYPVSSVFNELGEKLFKKLFRVSYPKIRLPNVYAYINAVVLKKYEIREIHLTEELMPFIDASLKQYDFYIKRDWKYMDWRYCKNPNLKYHVLEILENSRRKGLVFFSDINRARGLRIVYLMDLFFAINTRLNTKIALSAICDYYKKRGDVLDGIKSLQNAKWFGKIVRPINGIPFLSSLDVSKPIINPLITYSDQDMVEM